jgi:hypothetical protein
MSNEYNDDFEESSTYVCITHQQVLPCNIGKHHLVSNWVTDVHKILKIMEDS